MSVENREIRQSTNLDLCAVWKALGATIDPRLVDRTDPRHIKFNVEGLSLTETEKKWINRELMINARDFSDALKDLKGILHDC